MSLLVFAAIVSTSFAAVCQSPQHSASTFSTTDGFFHFQTAFITDFSLTCANKVKDAPYYAVINGETHYVAHSDETNKYQVSFTLEHDKAFSQTFNIQIYDEDSYKAFKQGEKASPLFTIPLHHPGLTRKYPVSCETVAIFTAIVGLYYAFIVKSHATA